MKSHSKIFVALFVISTVLVSARPGPATDLGSTKPSLITLEELEKLGRNRTTATPRITLAESSSEKLKGFDFADPLEGGRTPNYLRALETHTAAASQFGQMMRTFIYGGSLPPETKMAMALRVAQQLKSPYTVAHAIRWLRASEHGRVVLAQIRAGKLDALTSAEQLAVTYADELTNGVREVSDEQFQKTRALYNDSQIVELTMTVCLFNYFTRMSEALNLPVEMWVLVGSAQTPMSVAVYQPPIARVALISNDEMAATGVVTAAAKRAQTPAAGLGPGIANSQRAMLRAPALAQAWRDYGAAVRAKFSIDREIQLQISFAVSMANGCRYCTLHQVLGLRRLGVDPAKLVTMQKNDSALTSRELVAVTFARKVTRAPASITDEDFTNLTKEFGEQGAFEVLLQTCSFSFMNRFTDGLRLPSEDEAVRVYRETYRGDFKESGN